MQLLGIPIHHCIVAGQTEVVFSNDENGSASESRVKLGPSMKDVRQMLGFFYTVPGADADVLYEWSLRTQMGW